MVRFIVLQAADVYKNAWLQLTKQATTPALLNGTTQQQGGKLTDTIGYSLPSTDSALSAENVLKLPTARIIEHTVINLH
jgi:hypothetical protein